MKTDTIAAVATALSNAGIGIIRISGPDAFSVIDRIFQGKKGETYYNARGYETETFEKNSGMSDFYGDVKYIGLLLQNNLDLLEIYVFSAGTKVFIPEVPEEYDEDIPEWRR